MKKGTQNHPNQTAPKKAAPAAAREKKPEPASRKIPGASIPARPAGLAGKGPR